MAESSDDKITELGGSLSVQEVVSKADEIPTSYIVKNSTDYGPIDLNAPLTEEIPVIDVLRLDSAATPTDLEKLRSGLSSWGCIQAINHGIEEGLLQQLRQLSKQFFHLPLPEKHRYARQAGDLQGYGNDMVLFDDQTLDWTDRLYLFVNPQDQKKLHLWPQNPPSFRHTIEEYTHHALTLLNRLLKSMARTLNLPDGTFLKQFGDAPSCHLRFNYYPPCPRPDMVNGVKPHADGSGMTFVLLDDEVEGLQVLKDGAWFRIPAIRGALLVNLGDQLEIMSNGHLKSPVHRVVTNSNSERLTIAMFCSPGTGQEIGPDDRLIDEENPKLYKNTNDYVGIYFQYYQKGLRPIDAVRV